jgi:hypothetical protein
VTLGAERLLPFEHAPASRVPAADPTPTTRAALIALQIASAAVVLAALPYQLFELDRFTVPKELVLHLAAVSATLFCLASTRRLTLFMVDLLLAGFLVLSLLSTLFASNGWLAWRALGVSVDGALLFWCGRTLARAGHARPLLTALAGSVVLGAITGLIQAYGLVTTPLASMSRAPGGTFGNRNFMAHLIAIGLPVLLFVVLRARGRWRFGLGAAGVALAAAALVLSRSRAAWLGASACAVFLAVEGLWIGRLWNEAQLRHRVTKLAVIMAAALALALLLPNRLNWRSDSPYFDSLAGVANYKEGSGRGRLIQYGNSLSMAAGHLVLGVGPGNWPVYYPRYMSPGDPSFDADDIIPTNPWPSSDWVAMLSERGLPALLLLLLVGGSVAFGAWTRIRRGTRSTPALGDLAIVATLMAAWVVGAFDAVILLPVNAFFAWTIVGALASSARPVRELPLTPAGRRRLMLGIAVVGGLFLLRSAAQTLSMSLYSSGKRSAMELASRVDPGSYRIQMLLGMTWLQGGRCDRARPHAEAARRLFPNHPAPRQLLRSCGVRTRK